MKRYAIVIERGPTSYGAYVPDLPGCAAVGETEDEVRQLIREGIKLHLQGLVEDGGPIPEPASTVEYVALPIAS
ncbi:MAG: type II toxin-antitoxin system HicB family antitoxin [Bryobacterales bacterium]|nr:type II toxin-antitoxin system HicB family antitoxin [Bryobacterales bacterium]